MRLAMRKKTQHIPMVRDPKARVGRAVRAGVAVMVAVVLAAPVTAADWPAFRGPGLQGIAADTRAPVAWGDDQNVKWKVALARPGNGSPIVVAGRVFVTSAEDADGRKRSLYAFDADTGKQLWVRTVEVDKTFPTHDTNPYGGTTPVSDSGRVVVWHASAGLHCYDMDGKPRWSRDFGEFRHMWGYGTSPIVHNQRVILHSGPGQRVFVAALELDSGKSIWEHHEPLDDEPEFNKQGKYYGSWTTPVIATFQGREQIIVTLPTRVVALDPASGQLIWWCYGVRHAKGDLAYSSAVIVGDVCVVTGGFNGAGFAVRLGGTGDVTATHRLWRKESNPQSIGSGVAVAGLVYRPNAGPATIDCLEPTTGKVRWTGRAGVGYWSSIIKVGELLYAIDQDADTTIFRPNPDRFEIVATNKLDATTNATPAAANGRLYLRTDALLYCVGE
jgi:outer membrane protein assembly factor BamB